MSYFKAKYNDIIFKIKLKKEKKENLVGNRTNNTSDTVNERLVIYYNDSVIRFQIWILKYYGLRFV